MAKYFISSSSWEGFLLDFENWDHLPKSPQHAAAQLEQYQLLLDIQMSWTNAH